MRFASLPLIKVHFEIKRLVMKSEKRGVVDLIQIIMNYLFIKTYSVKGSIK